MTDAGSGAAPTTDAPAALLSPPVIEGWEFIPGNPTEMHYVPDRTHPLHPFHAELRRRPRLMTDLEADERIAAFIAEHRGPVRQQVAHYRRAGKGIVPVWLRVEAAVYLRRLQGEIERFAGEAAPRGIDPWVVYQYVLLKLLPPKLLDVNLLRLEPLTVMIGTDGAITMRFFDASQRDRERYDPLIQLAQAALGYRKDAGGNRSIIEDPVKNEQARTVAKLAWMGLSTPEIAAFMGWLGGKAAEKRVADYLDAGDKLLGEDDPFWPNRRPVPPVRPPKRTGLGPPWGEGRLEGGQFWRKPDEGRLRGVPVTLTTG